MAKFCALLMVLFWASLSHAAFNDDGEDVPSDEELATQQVVAMIRQGVQEGFVKMGHAHRDAHRKTHGCVQAKFTVLPLTNLELAQGIFKKPAAFDAWIRFSNGSGKSQDDQVGDGRGMAIKILNVGPTHFLPDEGEGSAQDFLMINHPVFFVRNAVEYVGFQKATRGGSLRVLWWLGTHIFHEGWIAFKIRGHLVKNPLNASYFSMVPSRLGPKQMKFSAQPCADSKYHEVSSSEERLRENMTAHLALDSSCFDFKIQLRSDPAKMPIEDPTIEWSEVTSPYVTVAKINVPTQVPKHGEECEVMAFTPWHSVAELRPLGGISRVRRAVYQEISKLRRQLNQQEHIVPLGSVKGS